MPLGKRLVARGCSPLLRSVASTALHAEPLYSLLDEVLRIVRIDPLLLCVDKQAVDGAVESGLGF